MTPFWEEGGGFSLPSGGFPPAAGAYLQNSNHARGASHNPTLPSLVWPRAAGWAAGERMLAPGEVICSDRRGKPGRYTDISLSFCCLGGCQNTPLGPPPSILGVSQVLFVLEDTSSCPPLPLPPAHHPPGSLSIKSRPLASVPGRYRRGSRGGLPAARKSHVGRFCTETPGLYGLIKSETLRHWLSTGG